MESLGHNLGVIVAIGSLLGAALVSWGVTKATIYFNTETLKDLKYQIGALKEEVSKATNQFRAALYGPDGVTIFTPRRICTEMREECNDKFCQKIEEVKQQYKEDKRDLTSTILQNRETVGNQFGIIKDFLDRLDQTLKSIKSHKE